MYSILAPGQIKAFTSNFSVLRSLELLTQSSVTMQGHHLPAAVKFVDTEVKQACMSCDKCQHMSTHSLL